MVKLSAEINFSDTNIDVLETMFDKPIEHQLTKITGYVGMPQAIFRIKEVKRIPKYASKNEVSITYCFDDCNTTTDGIHFIIREYKRHPGKIFYYGYFIK